MKIRVLLSCALAALLLAGCIARLPDTDTLPPDFGDSSAADPETIAAPETTPSPESTAETSAQADGEPRLSSPIAALTGPPPAPIHEQYPDLQHLPASVEWDGVLYKRLDFYISDEDCAELDPKGSYTWWSDDETSHKLWIRLYSAGDISSTACVATDFGVFEKGSLAVYVNEAEWTEEMEEALKARAVQVP